MSDTPRWLPPWDGMGPPDPMNRLMELVPVRDETIHAVIVTAAKMDIELHEDEGRAIAAAAYATIMFAPEADDLQTWGFVL